MSQQVEAAGNRKKSFKKSPLLVIFLTVFIDLIGFGIVIPILPYYAKRFGATPLEGDLLFASYSLMQFIFAPVLGQLSDKYGRRPILLFSILGTSFGFIVLGLANALWLLFAGRIIAGIMGANISTAQTYIADITTDENRAKGMGLIGAAFGLGFVFGPAIGGILSQFGPSVPFFFAAGLALVNAALLYFLLPETIDKTKVAVGEYKSRLAVLSGALTDSRFAIVTLIYFFSITSFSIMTASFAYYTMHSFSYNEQQTGYLFAYIGILAIILQGGLIGMLSRKFGEVWLVAIGCLILVVSFFIVPYISATHGGLIALLVGIAFFSIGNSISSPSLTSLGSKYAPENEKGATLGVLQSAASLARAIGPALSGVLLYSATAPDNIDDFSLFRTFWTASAIMALAFLLSLYFMRNRHLAVA
jgi:DHA1 family tetracycline resistance protein-like MFS transporter